jgi:hypothetical protein
LVIVSVISMASGAAVLAGKPTPEISLLVTFGSGAADTLRSDGFTAPGYEADYANGLENVLAILQGTGNFRFSTQNNTRQPVQRRLCFDFGAQSVPFAPAQCVSVQQPMHAYPTGNADIQNLRYGQSVQKLTRFAWDDGDVRYRLGYGTDMDMNGIRDSPAVNVTCIAPPNASQPCTTWVLAPETDGTTALFQFALMSGSGKNITEGPAEFIGTYVMPFVQTLTVKQ